MIPGSYGNLCYHVTVCKNSVVINAVNDGYRRRTAVIRSWGGRIGKIIGSDRICAGFENKMTDLLTAGVIHVFADGFTDHRVTKLEPVAFVATTSGSPIFTLCLDKVKLDLLVALLFFWQARAKMAKEDMKRTALIIGFIINIFGSLFYIR